MVRAYDQQNTPGRRMSDIHHEITPASGTKLVFDHDAFPKDMKEHLSHAGR